MTSLARSVERPARGAFRWAFSLAVVAAAHGAAMLAFLNNPASSDSDFAAGAAVVMIDLPEAAAATATPPSDLAPGPEEPQSESTPPPKEETKPPEQVAEVALPEPEPPKPEPPAEEKPATAPPSVVLAIPNEAPPTAGVEVPQQPRPPSPTVRRWQSGLSAQIARFKRYPAKALARREQGVVRIAFTLDRNGRVLESRILESSGSSDLDQEFLAMLVRAQPLPKPPPDAQPADLLFVMATKFSLE
jgi:periplasmic protein TonB